MPKITRRIHSNSQKRVIVQNPHLKVGDQPAQDEFEEEYQKFLNNLKQKKATVEENKVETIEEKTVEEKPIEETKVEETKVESIEEKPVESVENKPKKTKKKSKIVEENETSK